MPVDPAIIAAITSAIGSTSSIIATSAPWDAFEAYVFSLVLTAARTEGGNRGTEGCEWMCISNPLHLSDEPRLYRLHGTAVRLRAYRVPEQAHVGGACWDTRGREIGRIARVRCVRAVSGRGQHVPQYCWRVAPRFPSDNGYGVQVLCIHDSARSCTILHGAAGRPGARESLLHREYLISLSPAVIDEASEGVGLSHYPEFAHRC